MARIPTFARKHIPQAVGTPGVDPTAGAEAQIVGATASKLGQVITEQKKVADQATSSKLNREATIEYAQKVTDLKTLYKDDPEKMTKEIQKAGEEIFTGVSGQISSPDIRNSFLQKADSTITSQTVAAMRWSAGEMNNRAKGDFNETRVKNTQALGSAADAIVFDSEATNYKVNNRELYNTIYGENGPTNLRKDLSDGAERFLQNQVADDPHTALQTLESGKMDQYLTTEEKNKWSTRAKQGINNFEKNRITSAKSSAVVRATELGEKIKSSEVTPKDVENEYLAVKDNPDIPQEYKDSLRVWAEQMYEGTPPSLIDQEEAYAKFSPMLTELQDLAKGDPDKYFDAVLGYKAALQDAYNKKQLTNASFSALYSNALAMVDSTAAEMDGAIKEKKAGAWFSKSQDIPNATKAYARFDRLLDAEFNREAAKDISAVSKNRLGVTLKTNYQIIISAYKKKRKGKLTTQDYNNAEAIAIKSAKDELYNSVFGEQIQRLEDRAVEEPQ